MTDTPDTQAPDPTLKAISVRLPIYAARDALAIAQFPATHYEAGRAALADLNALIARIEAAPPTDEDGVSMADDARLITEALTYADGKDRERGGTEGPGTAILRRVCHRLRVVLDGESVGALWEAENERLREIIDDQTRRLARLRGLDGGMLAAMLRDAGAHDPTVRDVEIAREVYAETRNQGRSWSGVVGEIAAKRKAEGLADG